MSVKTLEKGVFMARKPFSIYKRKNSPYYNVQFSNPDGTPGAQKSSGETTKARAEQWAIEQIKEGNVTVKSNQHKLTQYTVDFFAFEGRWATRKKNRGHRISERHCLERAKLLQNQILPVLGDYHIKDITKRVINDFSDELSKQYSGQTINHILSVLKAILTQAETDEIIKFVPTIERAAIKKKNGEKEILTKAEMKKLFSDNVQWLDIRGKTAALLAATTGMRLGEIQALTPKDLFLDKSYLICSRSYDQHIHALNETTKTGKKRKILLVTPTIKALKELIKASPNPDNQYIFWGDRTTRPIYQPSILKWLYNAFEQIGIDDEMRRQRNLNFHAFRHFYNSLLIDAGIPMQKVQALTGHLTEEMTNETYYHVTDMKDVTNVINTTFKIKK